MKTGPVPGAVHRNINIHNLMTTAILKTLLTGFILFSGLSLNLPGINQISTEKSENKVLMAIFAHPDDETLVSPILYQYANAGVEVILVIATDGRLGFTDFTDYEDEDELASVRRNELRCAADILGIEMIHLDYEDQFGISKGHNEWISQTRGFMLDLHNIIEEKNPDAIITFGPDGFSNHMDHRLTGLTVTQVVLSREWEKTPELYYFGVPSSLLDDQGQMFMGVDDSHLTLQIQFSNDEAAVAKQAALCHKSQFTTEFVEEWINTMNEWGNKIHFRPFKADGEKRNSLFN